MKENDLNWGQRIALEALWCSARLFAVLPYWFKFYVVENLLFFLLFYVVRYRRNVVTVNLSRSFPEKSQKQIAQLRRKFYRTLAEIIIDTINMAGASDEKLRSLIIIEESEEHRAAVRGRDWIAMTAHFGCWEYCSRWGLYEPDQITVAVYHPLRNPVVEHFYRRLRNNDNATTVAMKDCLRFYLRNRESGIDGKRLVMGLIADQNPPRRPDSHWFRFLNQETLFFDGGEKLALRCNLPVYFVKLERMGRGRYKLSFEQLYDGVEPLTENEITERYVRVLENAILEHPELWLWSHKRWKHKRK